MTAPACKPIPQLTDAEIARFYSKIDRTTTPDGCHLWTGYLNDRGYAIFFIDRKRFRASRVSYFLKHGEDPFPWLIRHTCDVEACVREEHLKKGSDQDNMADAVERKTMACGKRNGAYTHPEKWLRGEDNLLSKLTNEQVLWAREHYAGGGITAREIAATLKVSAPLIQRILRGEIWKHIGGKTWEKLPKGPIPKSTLDYVRNRVVS